MYAPKCVYVNIMYVHVYVMYVFVYVMYVYVSVYVMYVYVYVMHVYVMYAYILPLCKCVYLNVMVCNVRICVCIRKARARACNACV